MTRLIKAVVLVVLAFFIGDRGGYLLTLIWGWSFSGWTVFFGAAMTGIVQGLFGSLLFCQFMVKRDEYLRLRTAQVMAWVMVGLLCVSPVLYVLAPTDRTPVKYLTDLLLLSGELVPWCFIMRLAEATGRSTRAQRVV